MKQHLLKLCKYNIWANNLMATWLLQLNQQQLHQNSVSSFASIFKTALHIYGAEDIWHSRLNKLETNWQGNNLDLSCQQLMDNWALASANILNTLQHADDAFLNSALNFKTLSGQVLSLQVADVFTHVVNHSSYHRGQLVTMLRQVNYTQISSLDYSSYCQK
jgi:uncharacterized damage-inducible protein DinB